MATISHLDEFRTDTLPLTSDHLRKAELPIERRGYSREAVDALLAGAADALAASEDELRRVRNQAASIPIEDVGQEKLMSLVGENVAEVLSEAQQSAAHLRNETEGHAKRVAEQAKSASERVVREAEEHALTIREAAQEAADSLMAEARRDKDSMRVAAEEAATVMRAQAKADADRMLAEAKTNSSQMLGAASDETRELREATDREARRHLQEAKEISATKIKAAGAQADDTVGAAKKRAEEIETENARNRRQGEAAVEQLSQAREVLTARLTATHNGLVQLLTQVGELNGGPLLSVETPGGTPPPHELISGDPAGHGSSPEATGESG